MANPGLAEEKKASISARLMGGEKPANIAAIEEVSYSSVMRVKHSLPSDVLENMSNQELGVISDLIMMQLESGIEASIAIAEQVKDAEWRKSQAANQLATLYGVVTDKSIRLLEASENAARARSVADATSQEYSN